VCSCARVRACAMHAHYTTRNSVAAVHTPGEGKNVIKQPSSICWSEHLREEEDT